MTGIKVSVIRLQGDAARLTRLEHGEEDTPFA